MAPPREARFAKATALRAALRAPDLLERRGELVAQFEVTADAELLLQIAYVDYMVHDFDAALRSGEAAYRGLRKAGRKRRAALAAAAIGRIYFEGMNNQAAARGWFARGRTMLAEEGDCIERGWVELGLVGCSVTDVGALAERAAEAVQLARRFDDLDLECKALADQGLALVTLGNTESGMGMIDEAMAILSTGEVHAFAAGQVSCCTLTACERAGDPARADAWLRALEEAGVSPRDNQTTTLFAHCQATYGSLLCEVGRWAEAEAALTLSLAAGRSGFYLQRVMARAALADLRIRQSRLQEADELLAGCGDRWEAMPSRARLFHAKGEYDQAVSTVKQAMRQIGADRVRAVPLLTLLAVAEVARGDLEAGLEAGDRAQCLAADTGSPVLLGQAALARATVLGAAGNRTEAATALETCLAALVGTEHLLIKGALHLALARNGADSDPSAAVAEARTALAIYQRLDAPEAEACATLLRRLGAVVNYLPRPSADPLAALSRREREVVRLVGQGLSNPRIGELLFISPRTVEHHVSSILGKLSLQSRFEVAALHPGLAARRGAR